MNYFTLKKYTNNTEIFSGYYDNLVQCIEDAVRNDIDLSGIDLRNQDLSNANIDGAKMDHGYFDSTNLTGANMSECSLIGCIFKNCDFYNTCFAYSDLQNSNFSGAAFGGTLIEGANIQDCIFSTLSCFDLEFSLSSAMQGCIFTESNGVTYQMSEPPLILKGFMSSPIIIMDKSVKIGSQIFPYDIMPSLIKLIDNVMGNPLENECLIRLRST